jgi:hypothetical protein
MHGAEVSSAVVGSIRSDEVGQGQQKDDASAAFRSLLNSPRRVLIISDDEEEDFNYDEEHLNDENSRSSGFGNLISTSSSGSSDFSV